MKADEKKELIEAARTAQPENPSFWDQIAAFFESQEGKAEEVVKPRKLGDY